MQLDSILRAQLLAAEAVNAAAQIGVGHAINDCDGPGGTVVNTHAARRATVTRLRIRK